MQPTVGATNPSKVSWQIRRYTPEGLPDNSFGVSGSVTVSFDIDFGGFLGDDYPNGVALLPDGRFVVVGDSLGGSSECSLGCESSPVMARFNVDGSLDSSFGSNGKVRGGTSLGNDAVVVQSDGRILTSGNQSIPRLRIAFMQLGRVNADGSIDQGYAASIACNGNGTFRSAPNGKIVIGTTDPSGDFCIARLNADGTSDTSFGTQGRTILKDNDNNSILGDIFVDAAGAITGVGWAVKGTLFRLTANGNLDTTFGLAGMVESGASRAASTGIGDCSTRTIIATQGPASGGSFSTARFSADGSMDLAFAGTANGFALTDTGTKLTPLQLLLRPNGRIVALAIGNGMLNVFQYKGDAPCGGATGSTVIEFYNTTLDNYFITANSNEAAAIDNGSAGPGWSRTGHTFKSGGNTAVCRFYGSLSPGPNSHFYTLAGPECNGLLRLQASTPSTEKRWNFESLDFVSTPASNNRTCPTGTAPIYRAYNNGFTLGVDSNHRITTSEAGVLELVSRGWSNEGVVMCAPQ